MSVLVKCPSYKESNKRNKQRQGPTKCPFYRGVRLIEVSVKRESTVLKLEQTVSTFSSFTAMPTKITKNIVVSVP